MKVRMLTSMAGMNFSYEPGREVDVEDYVGEAWQQAGIAEEIPDSSEVKADKAKPVKKRKR